MKDRSLAEIEYNDGPRFAEIFLVFYTDVYILYVALFGRLERSLKPDHIRYEKRHSERHKQLFKITN